MLVKFKSLKSEGEKNVKETKCRRDQGKNR